MRLQQHNVWSHVTIYKTLPRNNRRDADSPQDLCATALSTVPQKARTQSSLHIHYVRIRSERQKAAGENSIEM